MKRFFAQCYIWLLLIILYAPIVFIAVFSFTESKVLGNWTGFSTKLYSNLFTGNMQGTGSLMTAIENTLLIALIAAVVSTALGTIAAIGLHNMRGRGKQVITFMNNIPMLNPDIITGVSLFLLFVFLHISQGYVTVVLAHITFCTPYVVLSVLPKLTQMNPNIYEAALDLGCTPVQAFFKVKLPNIMPGVLSGFVMAFTLSLDDFVITYFTRGSQFQTLPIQIYTMTHQRINPKANALSALLFVAILLILILINIRNNKEAEKSRA